MSTPPSGITPLERRVAFLLLCGVASIYGLDFGRADAGTDAVAVARAVRESETAAQTLTEVREIKVSLNTYREEFASEVGRLNGKLETMARSSSAEVASVKAEITQRLNDVQEKARQNDGRITVLERERP